jgi:DNA-binding beta-propeller fold protein YncE
MKSKKVKTKAMTLAICVMLLVTMSGMVSGETLESVTTMGQAVPVPTPLQELEHSYVTTDTFTSFNIDVGGKFRSGSAVTPDSKTVYVMICDSPTTIAVIDATIDQFTKTIDLSSVSPGMLSGGVVVGSKLYAVGDSKVVIMDTSTEQIVNSIPQSFSGGHVHGRASASPTKDRVYTVSACACTMLAIDTSTDQLIGSADIGNENTGIGVSLSGDKIYISDQINGHLTIVDANDFSIIAVKSFITGTGIQPYYSTNVAVGQDGLVYVGYTDSNSKFCVAILDSDGNLIDTIITTRWSEGLEISKDGKYLITGSGNIIDVNTKTVIADVSTGSGSYQVDVSPDGLRAYVTNYNSNYVTVIEGFEPPILPDLVITEKWLCWPDNCTICYNVTNIGNEVAHVCHHTTLYVDGTAVAHDHVPVELAPGESYTGCFNGYVWTYTPPSDNITVCADNNETVDELDETNNCLTNIWMCGDVNCDGKVTMSDVRKVFNRYLDPNYPLDLPWAADVNCDGKVSMSDVRKVFNRYLDPGYELNCCCEGVG